VSIGPESLMPKNSHDIENAEKLVRLGYPAVEPVIPEMLMWLQDLNYSVSFVFSPFLSEIGEPLIPHLRKILQSDDNVWKYSVLRNIVLNWDTCLVKIIEPDLIKLTMIQDLTEVDIEAIRILIKNKLGDPNKLQSLIKFKKRGYENLLKELSDIDIELEKSGWGKK